MQGSSPKRPKRRVNGILLLDKPSGLSSNDALQIAKRHYRAEKAGHTGTLDPLATGLLPLCFGQATKLSGLLLDSDKGYTATVRFGAQTETGDAEGAVIATSDAALLTVDALRAVLPRFTGTIQQIPPMYSALKHQGQRLYELARAGETVERSAREVCIQALSLHAFADGVAVLDVRCSKGTYIRTLAEDIAAALGQKAHLSALRRTHVAPFDAARLVSLEQIEAAAAQSEAVLDTLLSPLESALVSWPRVEVDAVRAEKLARGMSVPVAGAPRQTQVALFGPAGLLAVGETEGESVVAPKRWLRDSP